MFGCFSSSAANYTHRHEDGAAAVTALASRVRAALSRLENSMETLHGLMYDAYVNNVVNGEGLSSNEYTALRPGVDYFDVDIAPPTRLEYVNQYKQRVPMNASSVKMGDDIKQEKDYVMQEVYWTQDAAIEEFVIAQKADNFSELQWQYFGSANGVLRTFPGHRWSAMHSGLKYDYDPRYRCVTRSDASCAQPGPDVRTYDCLCVCVCVCVCLRLHWSPWYLMATAGPKDVVIVFDTSFSMNSDRRSKGCDLAATLLSTLGTEDYVAVVNARQSYQGYWNEWRWADPVQVGCVQGQLAPATPSTKKDLSDRIADFSAYGGTDAYGGLEMAYDLLETSPTGSGCAQYVIFITDGLKDGDYDASDYYNAARDGKGSWDCCGRDCVPCWLPGDVKTYKNNWKEAASLAQEKYADGIRTFVFDVGGKKNKRGKTIAKVGGGYYQKYQASWTPYERVQPGWITFLQQNTKNDATVWTAPFIDAAGSGLIMSVCKPLWYGDTLVGVVANDINLAALEKVLLYGTWGTAYSFLTNREAQTMVHPNLDPPSHLSSNPIFPDIGDLETVNGVPAQFLSSVRAGILSGSTGAVAIDDGLSLMKRGSSLNGFAVVPRSLEYFYAPVVGADFMVCFVLVTPNDVHYRIPMSPANMSGATAYYDKLMQCVMSCHITSHPPIHVTSRHA